MHVQTRVLSLAIVAALAAAAPAAADAFNRSVATRAQGLVDGPAAKAVRRASADAFVARDAIVDAKGTEHVRFARTHRGLPVIGGDFVLHSRNGKVERVSQTLKTTLRPNVTPRISSNRAIIEAGADFGTGFHGVPKARLVVYALGARPALAYEVTLSGTRADQTPTDMHYFVDANTGRVLNKWDTVMTARGGPGGGGGTTTCTEAVGTGNTLTEGDVVLDTAKCGTSYQMKDLTRGGGYTTNMGMRTTGMGSIFTDADNNWGNNLLSSAQTVGADAHFGVSMTWDYFAEAHGRNGIANDGRGAVSRVHYGRNYANAFWRDSCFCMTFGDGDNGVTINPLVALDVAGHEMSHGVTSRTAGLIYEGESGGLNEATSDIFGTMVEYYVNNTTVDPVDYMIGENIYANNSGTTALRYMFKPSLDGASPDCYYDGIGGIDVHYNSGVANHFFYLLAEGAVVPAGFGAGTEANLTASSLVCNGNTAIAGIGRDDAGAIWYRALTMEMTSSTSYAGARTATLQAAADLFGGGSAQYNAVNAAWDAVSVPVEL